MLSIKTTPKKCNGKFFFLFLYIFYAKQQCRLPGGPYMAHRHILRPGFDETRAKHIHSIMYGATFALANLNFNHWFPPCITNNNDKQAA